MPSPFSMLPSRNRISCSALAVDGLARGAVLGAIWGACFHGVGGLSSRSLIGSVARNSATFALFLGAYGGVSCFADKRTRSKATVLASFMGGFTAGAAVSLLEATTRRGWVMNGGAAGLLTALFTYATLSPEM